MLGSSIILGKIMMKALTFLRAWNESIRSKSKSPLLNYLDESCEIKYVGRSESQSREEHLAWIEENSIAGSIDGFEIFFERDGICTGCHSVNYTNGEKALVMFFGKYSDDKITEWTSLVSRDWKKIG